MAEKVDGYVANQIDVNTADFEETDDACLITLMDQPLHCRLRRCGNSRKPPFHRRSAVLTTLNPQCGILVRLVSFCSKLQGGLV